MAFKSRYWEQDAGDWKGDDDSSSLMGSSFTGSFLDDENFLDSARGYRAAQGSGVSPILPGKGVFSSDGSNSVLGGVIEQYDAESAFGADALGLKGELIAAKKMAEAQKDAAASQARGSNTGAIIGAVGSVGGAIAGALI